MKAISLLKITYCLFVLIAYSCVLISPGIFWPAAFLALLVPFIILFECIRLVFFAFRKSKNIIYPIILLACGFPFIKASFSFSTENKDDVQPISVLSYNARVFNLYNNNLEESVKPIDWVAKHSADVKCIQEFYNLDKQPEFATTKKISHSGEQYHFFQPVVINRIGGEFGLAIFSKYPIVSRGVIDLQNNSTNSAIFADIAVNGDTIRVINVHLQSLSLGEDDLALQEQRVTGLRSLMEKLKVGFLAREKQLRKIERYLEDTQYPIIVCGDLNDTPYSYSYFKLRHYLNNAFEEQGMGFGFSYNGSLSFLRIDNQFFSERLSAIDFKTHYEVDYSDHYPITASYSIK
ncbi:MAG: endonuclease/exonuclease/phosphatase [Thalassobius sp.]|nr:endonuclease/exonuclease/phosphatase [Thalassovita sp.]